MSANDFRRLISKTDDEPIFSEPWEANAFALTVALFEKGHFTWDEWAKNLSSELEDQPDRPYFKSWLAALENLIGEKRLSDEKSIAKREQAWHAAAARTPHGEPIEL